MKRLRQSLLGNSGFTVVAELTSGRGYSMQPIIEFLEAHKASAGIAIPEGFDFAGIALPQNPGGVSNLDPTDVLAQLTATDLLVNLDFIPHISCKDHNKSALHSMLIGYKQRHVESVLALTGDVPASAKGVFELESIGLLQLIGRINRQEMLELGSRSIFTDPVKAQPVIFGVIKCRLNHFQFRFGSFMQNLHHKRTNWHK